LHHAGDDAPHATASSAIAAIERNKDPADLAEVLLNAVNLCIVASVLFLQPDRRRRAHLILREEIPPAKKAQIDCRRAYVKFESR
jgi:hypothetical protein